MARTGSTAVGGQATGWRSHVSPVLATSAAWAWRFLLLAAAAYAVVWFLGKLVLVVVPTFLALVFTALLAPVVDLLTWRKIPRALVSAVVLTAAFAAGVGVVYFVVTQLQSRADELVGDVSRIGDNVRGVLAQVPGMGDAPFVTLQQRLEIWLQNNRSVVVSDLLMTGRLLVKLVTGLVLTLFLTFFFLAQGDRLWSWLVRLVPDRARASVNGAGHSAWRVLSGWLVGTAVIATIHAVVVGVVLWLLGTSLVVPLAVLVFVGSFIPDVGAVVFGGVAVLVTLLSVGPVGALILLVVLAVENHLEGYVFQPLIVGRAVQLHPVAIVVAITGGAVLGGVVGVFVAVPIVASVHAAVKYLTGVEDVHGRPLRDEDRMAPIPPPDISPVARGYDQTQATGDASERAARDETPDTETARTG